MHSFILNRKPLSYNSCRKQKKVNYKADLEGAFSNYNPSFIRLSEKLYALVYYFYKVNVGLDADNLSKPIWDCLTGFLYDDDEQIKIRTAGSFDLSKGDFQSLDFTGLSGSMVAELTAAALSEEHVLYIECGQFDPSMFKFNIEE